MSRRTLFLSALLIVGAFAVFHFHPVLASGDPLGIDYGQQSGLSNQDVRVTVVRIIRFFLGLLGLIFLVLTLYAGFLWMTSAGNDDKVTKAKQILMGSIIGVAIILGSYAITEFVIVNLYETTSNVDYRTP
jgi:hypothetical protein